jgi:dolichol-phosphate mannosyltransferase
MSHNLISVVLPAHNEEGNAAAIHGEIRSQLNIPGVDVEIIFVDDGSTDATAERIRELRRSDPCVRLIRFSRNFGQQAALLAGLQGARGVAVITMDCDLQHPPEYLPRMIAEWRSGAKIVRMIRRDTTGATRFKKVTSRMFYRLLQAISETPVVKDAADYQLLDRQIVDQILRFGDRQPFLRGMVSWLGYPERRIEYIAASRHSGSPGYSFRKMVRLSLDATISLSSKPLRMALYLGFCSAFLSLVYLLFALIAYQQGKVLPGWTSIFGATVFLGGVQLICIGIIGEYIARIYDHTRRVPPYVIAEEDGAGDQTRER